MTDAEVIAMFMLPLKKGQRPPEKGNFWWYWSDLKGDVKKWPQEVSLDALHEVEGRLTDEQFYDYALILGARFDRPAMFLSQVRKLIFASAPQKLAALAHVLRPSVEKEAV